MKQNAFDERMNRLSRKVLRVLRHEMPRTEMMQVNEGYVTLSELTKQGVPINRESAVHLCKGKGGMHKRGLPRFEGININEEGETIKIRLNPNIERSRDERKKGKKGK